MPLLFTNQPDKAKSFFENYYDHLSFFYKARNKTNVGDLLYQWLDNIGHDTDNEYGSSFYIPTAIPLKPMVPFTRLRMHRALHDAYDYLDEILAATIIPPLLIMASAYLLMRALIGGLTFGQIYSKPYNSVTNDLFNACMGLFLTAFSFLKASLSLVVRPILTLFNGFNVDAVSRFCHETINNQDPDTPDHSFIDDDHEDISIYDKLEEDWHLAVRPMLGFK